MTAPIRSMADLVEALRNTQVERELSYELLDAISGLQSGYTAKLLSPTPAKRLGPVSTFPLLGALGKALAIVDDPEQIALVKGRWKKRKIVGGSSRQIKVRAASMIATKLAETPENIDRSQLFALMQKLGRAGGIRSGKTRQAQAKWRRELKAKRAAAARLRWDREKSQQAEI